MRTRNDRHCIVLIADIHARSGKPRRRLQPVMPETHEMLGFVATRAKELGAEAVVCLGDVGQGYDWTLGLLADIQDAFEQFGGLPFYTIVGNHDLPAHNYDRFDRRCGLWHLHQQKIVRLLWEPKRIGDFLLWPFHSGKPETIDLVAGTWQTAPDYIADPQLIHVALVHAPVGAEAMECAGILDHKTLMLPSLFKYAGFGDIHPGFPPYASLTGPILFNPGALAQQSIEDAGRTPNMAILWSDGKLEYEPIPVGPVEERFDLTGAEADKEKEEWVENLSFAAAVAAAQTKRDELDSRGFVRAVGSKAGMTERQITILEEELAR